RQSLSPSQVSRPRLTKADPTGKERIHSVLQAVVTRPRPSRTKGPGAWNKKTRVDHANDANLLPTAGSTNVDQRAPCPEVQHSCCRNRVFSMTPAVLITPALGLL